jgi:hypothetical protein
MEKWLQLFLEGLTKLPGMDTITISETDLLKIHDASLEGYTDGNILDLLTKNKKFQSVHDKFVNDKLTTQKGDLTKSHDDLLQEKEDIISKLKSSIPIPNSPDEIKKRLESETDPTEKRMLELEYRNAVNLAENASLRADSQKSQKIATDAELLKTLNAHVKDKKYAVSDASSFVQYGDKAIDQLDIFGAKLTETLNEMVSKIAKDKYSVNPVETGKTTTTDPNAMTFDEINEKYPGNSNQDKRVELIKKYNL